MSFDLEAFVYLGSQGIPSRDFRTFESLTLKSYWKQRKILGAVRNIYASYFGADSIMNESALNSVVAMEMEFANPEKEQLNKSYNGSSAKCHLGIGHPEKFDQSNTGITAVPLLEFHKILVQKENVMTASSTVIKEALKNNCFNNNRISTGKFDISEDGHIRSPLNPSHVKIHKNKSNKENVNNVNISPLAEHKTVLKEEHFNKIFPIQPVKAIQVINAEESIHESNNTLYRKRGGDSVGKENKPRSRFSLSIKVKEDILDKKDVKQSNICGNYNDDVHKEEDMKKPYLKSFMKIQTNTSDKQPYYDSFTNSKPDTLTKVDVTETEITTNCTDSKDIYYKTTTLKGYAREGLHNAELSMTER
ncbi:unnamed protein product [Mytilus coruscus]|uniref:Uncharacterized protein n=1 Tax=Mytilus coruscus TaxID=42192 RepID=A0A6J8C8M3_MYTCO|nr:unnamed protein product [Mytilus coruscus]